MVRSCYYDSLYDTTLYWINGMDANNAEKWAVGTTQPHFLTCDTYFFSFWDGVDHELPLDTIFIYYFENALMTIHQSQEEVAEIYGGTFFYRFRKIIAPLLHQDIVWGALLIFVKTIGEFGTPVTMETE